MMANKHRDRKMVQEPLWNYDSTEHLLLASISAI